MKTIRTVLWAVCFGALLAAPASAYVDPSVTTFAIQAVVGVIVVAGAVVGVAWRKAKKKAMQALHIDENAGKTVEEDIVVFDETPAEAGETAEATEAAEVTETAESAE